jgi:anti-anti-sigma factor
MQLRRHERGGVDVLTLAGSIHAEDNDEFAAELGRLRDGGRHRLVIDASALEYVNSRAVGTLVAFAREARLAGGKVVLVRPGPTLSKVLSAVGLLSLVPTYGALEAAVESCRE